MNAIVSRLRREDSGFTLIELIVASMVSLILGAVILTSLLGAQAAHRNTTAQQDLTAEARDALNRLAMDLRQAKPTTLNGVTTPAITGVTNPWPGGTTGATTAITFNADFNGDGCVAGVNSDTAPGSLASCNPAPAVDSNAPETETFCWNPTKQQVFLIGGSFSGTCDGTEPLLSGKVTNFRLEYDSSRYLCDANSDGVTTWLELDSCGGSYGNNNGTLDTTELLNVNSVGIAITVSDGTHKQSYQTQVNLRNVS